MPLLDSRANSARIEPEFRDEINESIRTANIKKSQFAALVGISPATFSQILSGYRLLYTEETNRIKAAMAKMQKIREVISE